VRGRKKPPQRASLRVHRVMARGVARWTAGRQADSYRATGRGRQSRLDRGHSESPGSASRVRRAAAAHSNRAAIARGATSLRSARSGPGAPSHRVEAGAIDRRLATGGRSLSAQEARRGRTCGDATPVLGSVATTSRPIETDADHLG
jgi:hypothetical protein